MPRRADAQLYVSQTTIGIVSEYDATTETIINANFITGLNSPFELLVSGDDLFVTGLTLRLPNTMPKRAW
jgi:hypothetical protein